MVKVFLFPKIFQDFKVPCSQDTCSLLQHVIECILKHFHNLELTAQCTPFLSYVNPLALQVNLGVPRCHASHKLRED